MSYYFNTNVYPFTTFPPIAQNRVSFGQNTQQIFSNFSLPNQPQPLTIQTPEKQKKNNSDKWLIGAALAVTAAAIYYFSKGKVNNVKQGTNLGDDIVRNTQKPNNTADMASHHAPEIKPKNTTPIVQPAKPQDAKLESETRDVFGRQQLSRHKNNNTQKPIDYTAELAAKGVKIQEMPREFAPHSYQPQDIPNINITSRTPEIDYRNWSIINGQQVKGGGYQYREAFQYLKMGEGIDAGKTILVIGKNSKGEKTVWLQGLTGRTDGGNRPIRTQYVMTVPKGKDFNNVQKDLIKGIYGRTQQELAIELPLSRSANVTNAGHSNLSTTPENIEFKIDTMLREINHYAQGREFTPELINRLKSVDNLKNGEYIRLV